MTVLFVYGTLQPGASHWRLLEPFVAGRPRRATMNGTLYDTGRGYPGLRLGGSASVPGWVVELADPCGAALSVMDDYEGPDYRRVLVTLADGTECWTYEWVADFAGLRRVASWPDLSRRSGHDRGAQGTLGG